MSHVRRVVLAVVVASLAVAPVVLGVLPLGRLSASLSLLVALAGAVGVWRATGLALAVASAGLTFAIADLAARPLLDRVHFRPDDRHAVLWRVDPSVARLEPNVDVIWPTVGDLAALGGAVRVPRKVAFRTDGRGLRTDPLPAPAEVVLLGDSFGAGVGTGQEEIVSAYLTRAGLPTVNLSVSGASPFDEAVTLADTLPTLDLAEDAVLVWLWFAGNDLGGACRDALPSPPSVFNRMWAEWATFRSHSVLGRLWLRATADPPAPVVGTLADGTELAFHRQYLEVSDLTEDEARALPQADCVAATARNVRDLAEGAGLKVVVAVAPMKAEIYGRAAGLPDRPYGTGAALLDIAAEAGFPVIDLRPPLAAAAHRDLAEGHLLWWPDDTHWNGTGHAVTAQTLAGAVRDAKRSAAPVR